MSDQNGLNDLNKINDINVMKDIHDIRPPVQVGFDPMLIKIALMMTGGLILLIILFFLIKKWLKKRGQPKDLKYLPAPVAPYDAALKSLDLLFQSSMIDLRLFYYDLSGVFKKYISRSFNINAIEMTSQEFIKHINQLDLDKEVKKDISKFQNISDPFKYAGVVPEKQQAKDDLQFIRDKIQQIEKGIIELKQKEMLKEKEEGDQ